MSWQFSLILFNWLSVQRLPLLNLQEAVTSSNTSCRQFGWTLHPCLSMRHSLWRLCPYQNHPHSPLASWRLMQLNTQCSMSFCRCFIIKVSSGPGWTERGLSGSCCHVQSWVQPLVLVLGCLITLCGAVITPSSDFLGVNTGPLAAMRVEWTAGRAVPLFCVEMARNSANGCPTRGVPIKVRLGKRGWWEEEFQKDELDC